ncbi:hypothetical protein DPMN_074298 [Dreissena polymorpha]|uniref:Uncharacterized protein n=1 Tax=Dreissena polymorpha TaxID=45954 RepID=A0A9D3YF28_DREPO|nr:hypothetical protein DPMN_074298 [Dreissena polymorpha]
MYGPRAVRKDGYTAEKEVSKDSPCEKCEALEARVERLEEKIDEIMGKLDELLTRQNKTMVSYLGQLCVCCKKTLQLGDAVSSHMTRRSGQSALIVFVLSRLCLAEGDVKLLP